MIGVGVEEASLRLGDFVTGNAYWSGEVRGPIHIELRWDAGGLASYDSFKIVREVYHDVETVPEGNLAFRWKLPHEGPMSLEGTAVSVRWIVRASTAPGLIEAADVAEVALQVLAGRSHGPSGEAA